LPRTNTLAYFPDASETKKKALDTLTTTSFAAARRSSTACCCWTWRSWSSRWFSFSGGFL